MDALPLTRHDWHGDWNYTLRPEAYDQAACAPDPFDQPGLAVRPSPDRAIRPGMGRFDHHPDDTP